MNHREPTTVPPGTGQPWLWMALLTLSMLVVARAWSRPMLPPPIIPNGSKPYLGAIGAPPVRFQIPAPPPDLVTRPAASAPPLPAAIDHPADGSTPEKPAEATAATASNPPGATVAAEATTTPPSATPVESPAATESETVSPKRTPPPIIRDELRPQTRAEDFLPFFQIPTVQPGDVSVVPVPRTPPATLPPSSATYTQTPR